MLLALTLTLGLTACDSLDQVKDVTRGVQDTVNKYGQQIEDSKDALNDAFDKMQGILDEVKDRTSGK